MQGAKRISPQLAFGINSAFAFASADLLTTALHETGHGIMAQSLGFAPKIYAFYENNPSGTKAQDLLILAAGPIASLLLGLIFLAVLRAGKPRYSFARLLLFWLAWGGILEFVNYLIITPFLAAGDTAQIADRLGWPFWPRLVIALLGIAIVFLLARPAAATMLAVAPDEIPLASPKDRRRFVFRGFYLPLFAGSLLTALAGIGSPPVVVFYGVLASVGSIDLIAVTISGINRSLAVPERSGAALRVEPAAILLYAIVAAWYILFLSHGIPV